MRSRERSKIAQSNSNHALYIGIQGAARNSVLIAANRKGEIKAALRIGPLALRVNADFRRALLIALNQLAAKLDLSTHENLAERTAGVCVSMSGIREKADAYAVSQALEEMWFTGTFTARIIEDVWSILAASGTNNGCAILASTGANVFIRNRAAKYVTVGGWGSDLADLGSGYYIGKNALNLVLDSADGRRDVSNRFVRAILDQLQLNFEEQIVPWYHEVRKTSEWRPRISDLAIVVCALAEGPNPDKQARQLLDKSSLELGHSIRAAFRRAKKKRILHIDDSFVIVYDGGMLRHSKYYQKKVANVIKGSILHDDIRYNLSKLKAGPLLHHPAIGAAAFAITGTRNLPSCQVFDQLLSSSTDFPELNYAAAF